MRLLSLLALSASCMVIPVVAMATEDKRPEIVAHQGIGFSRIDDQNRVIAYDPVAAFDGHRTAIADCGQFATSFKSVTWCFESEESKQRFIEASKERVNQYVPFGGGYCARGLSNGNFAPGDPRTHVRAGKELIVNGSWAVADDFFDDATRRAPARVMYRLSQRSGLLVPNDTLSVK